MAKYSNKHPAPLQPTGTRRSKRIRAYQNFGKDNGTTIARGDSARFKKICKENIQFCHPPPTAANLSPSKNEFSSPYSSNASSYTSSSALVSIMNEQTKTLIDRERDPAYQTSPECLNRLDEITSSMRWVLIDWMMEVCEAYTLKRTTLYYAINFMDRYCALTTTKVAKKDYQLLGIASLMLASKTEEIYPPESSEFIKLTVNAYTLSQLLKMERQLLIVLEWKLLPTTCFHWLDTHFHRWQCTTDEYQFNTASVMFQRFALSNEDLFLYMIRVLDVCTLHLESLSYPPHVLVNGVMLAVAEKCNFSIPAYLTYDNPTQRSECYHWLVTKVFPKVPTVPHGPHTRESVLRSEVDREEWYAYQTHVPGLAATIFTSNTPPRATTAYDYDTSSTRDNKTSYAGSVSSSEQPDGEDTGTEACFEDKSYPEEDKQRSFGTSLNLHLDTADMLLDSDTESSSGDNECEKGLSSMMLVLSSSSIE